LDRNFEKKFLTSAIQDSKNTLFWIIETERNKREKNLILHGVSEMSDTDDKAYVKSLLALIGVNIEPTDIVRLGKENENGRLRPIKLMMSSIEHKNLVLSRLVNRRLHF